jgi:hypothetical protein
MKPRSRAVLVVISRDLTGAELANAAGILPDKQWEKGVPRAQDARHGAHNAAGIEYTSRCDRSMPPNAHLEELGQRVRPGLQRLGRLRDDHDVEMRCWIYHESEDLMSGFDLSPDPLDAFVAAGCFVGINVDFVGDIVERRVSDN